MLAGVSTDLYTRLEKGHIKGISNDVLSAVARALQLDEAETAHLFHLARAARAAGTPPQEFALPARRDDRRRPLLSRPRLRHGHHRRAAAHRGGLRPPQQGPHRTGRRPCQLAANDSTPVAAHTTSARTAPGSSTSTTTLSSAPSTSPTTTSTSDPLGTTGWSSTDTPRNPEHPLMKTGHARQLGRDRNDASRYRRHGRTRRHQQRLLRIGAGEAGRLPRSRGPFEQDRLITTISCDIPTLVGYEEVSAMQLNRRRHPQIPHPPHHPRCGAV